MPHQANRRIIEAAARRAGIPEEKVFVNIERYGNTSTATVPLALDDARRQGRLEPGMQVLLSTFASGLTWASTVMEWE